MKKVLTSILLLLASILLVPFSYSKTFAETNALKIDTIYPENILDYANLDNISSFSINNDYIVYTLDEASLTIFNIHTKEYKSITGFSNISKIKLTNDKIIIADSTFIRAIDLNNLSSNISDLYKFTEISLFNLKTLDIFVSESKIFIATITGDTLKVFEYNLDLTTSKTNPIKTAVANQYNSAYMMAINNNNAYIVYETENLTKPRLCIQNYTSNTPIIKEFKSYAKLIDTISYKSIEYVLTFTNGSLYIFNSSCDDVVSNLQIDTEVDISDKNNKNFPILELTDIEYYNNTIYVSDRVYKTIQAIQIVENQTLQQIELNSNNIVLGSSHIDYGRFNNISNIYIQGNNIYTSDTGNNRIQYLLDNKPYVIDMPTTDSRPENVILDKYNNMYFSTFDGTNSTIYKYKFENNSYIFDKDYKQYNNIDIGYISDICVTNSNMVYALDTTHNKMLYISGNTLEETQNKLNLASISINAELKYIKSLDLLVLFNNSYISTYNLKGIRLDYITLSPDYHSITVDFDKIYAISNNNISTISIKDGDLVAESEFLDISSLSHLQKFSFDIVNRQMIAFDTIRHCLVKFDFNLSQSPLQHTNISESTALTSSDTLIPIQLKESTYLIYEYPYELGNYYTGIKECIAIGEFNEYYEVLIAANDELKIGYIPKLWIETKDAEIISHKYSPIEVITTYDNVPIYKYPTRLKYNDERLINYRVPIETILTVQYAFPISIEEGITFYLYKNQNTIGFLLSIEIVANQASNIQNLNTENAKVSLIGQESTMLLDEDKTTEIIEITKDTRIYVKNYDKNSKYTYVIFKDSSLNTYEGYILTEHIQMDKLDNSQVILILLIIASIIILILIITAYIIIKKKNK